jgi:hypothetical protein
VITGGCNASVNTSRLTFLKSCKIAAMSVPSERCKAPNETGFVIAELSDHNKSTYGATWALNYLDLNNLDIRPGICDNWQ